MKLLRIWAPDPSRPEFALEAERQGRLRSFRGKGGDGPQRRCVQLA
ncbi:MAG: hypothetical protein WBQ45_10555 [Roseiarcus sp.]